VATIAGGAGGSTAALEKKKRKKGGSGPGGAKRSKLLDFLSSSLLRSAGESEDDGGKGSPIAAASPPIAAQPITVAAPPLKPSLALEYSAIEPDNDDELALEIQSVLAATEPHVTTSPAAPSSPKLTSTSSDSLSSSSGEDVEGHGSGPQKQAIALDAGTTGAVGEGGQLPPAGSSIRRPATFTSTESSSYHVSTSDPVEVAAVLGMPLAKLIRGNIGGSLRFSSSERERRFLTEAGSSFGFPLMERRLMATGASQILQDVEHLSLKAFIASRCASRQLKIDHERASQFAGMEEHVASVEKEKAALEEALVAARSEAKSNAEAAEAACRDALAAEEAKANAEKAKTEAEVG